jgi:hypothetical protein
MLGSIVSLPLVGGIKGGGIQAHNLNTPPQGGNGIVAFELLADGQDSALVLFEDEVLDRLGAQHFDQLDDFGAGLVAAAHGDDIGVGIVLPALDGDRVVDGVKGRRRVRNWR